MNPLLEGKTYPSTSVLVERDRVAAFRTLFGQAEGIPPTFLTAAEFAVFPLVVVDPDLDLDYTRVVHGSQEYELHREVEVGETLGVTARIASIRHKGGTGFLEIETEMRDADGVLVAVARSTMIERKTD